MVGEKGCKTIIIGISIIMVIGLFGVAAWWLIQKAHYVTTDNAQIDGSIIVVSSQIPERIEEILVEEGQKIKEEETIARLSGVTLLAKKGQVESELRASKDAAEEYSAKVEVAKAKLVELQAGFRSEEIEQAKANLREAKAKVDEANMNLQRMLNLFQTGIVAHNQKDEAEINYRVAEEKHKSLKEKLNLLQAGTRPESIAIARAEISQAQKAYQAAISKIKFVESGLELIDKEFAKTIIKSPRAGVVAKKQVEKGEYVQSGQPIIAMMDPHDLWLRANIKETEIGRVKPGQKVSFKIDSNPNQEFKGKVLEVIPATGAKFALIPKDNAQGNFTKITQLIPVKISIEGLEQYNGSLRPGMSANIRILVKEN